MGCAGSKKVKKEAKLHPSRTEPAEKEHPEFEESKHGISKGNISEDSRVLAKLQTINNIYRVVVMAEFNEQIGIQVDNEHPQELNKKKDEENKLENQSQ
ncbi:unnamed protein product [Blepharisma stoltei]|uniref:Uncharacterized protein n=1 Tax=Blepharisma stoltei TaxID=1481888 RepID=A0AAU9I7Z8_9CILI|nr:unnamed protein product [Blepharisma stoltei]